MLVKHQGFRTHNWYAEFLKSFKFFIDKVTAGTITKYEFDYGSKTLEYYYLYKNQSFEYPTCVIEMNDLSLLDGVGPIARNAMMNINPSTHNIILAENLTTQSSILLDKRHVNITFNVSIACEDSAMLLNMHDLFISQLPMNYSFYDYNYQNFIEVTDFITEWDIKNHNILNIFKMDSRTDEYDDLEHGIKNPDRYFSSLMQQPVIEMTSCTKQNDKETQKHMLNVSFETMIEVPNVLLTRSINTIKSINLIIDTNNVNSVPIMIDIPENIATDKNIERSIIITRDNFDIDNLKILVSSEIDLRDKYLAIWAVEDSTVPKATRLFLPLENCPIEVHEFGYSIGLRKSEMDLFNDFNFTNIFCKIELMIFKE